MPIAHLNEEVSFHQPGHEGHYIFVLVFSNTIIELQHELSWNGPILFDQVYKSKKETCEEIVGNQNTHSSPVYEPKLRLDEFSDSKCFGTTLGHVPYEVRLSCFGPYHLLLLLIETLEVFLC